MVYILKSVFFWYIIKNHPHPKFQWLCPLLTCSCLQSSASRDLLEIRVPEIFKRSRALRHQRPNRILRRSIHNSNACFVQTVDNKSCLHIDIRPGQQAVCRCVWEEIPSHQHFSSSCCNLARVSLLFFPLFFHLSPALWLLFLGFPQVFISWSEKPASKLHLVQKSQSSFTFAFLLAYRAHWTDAPKFEKAAERN